MLNPRFALVLLVLMTSAATASAEEPAAEDAPKFELRDGDRVVFLGNTLIEREQKYGYWETMLTARYPDRHITFRNLGWDGDTVWADSRGYFDEPHVGYQRLLDHIRELKPTVIFLGYGNNEAFAGQAGLEPFLKQYNKLLDDLTAASAQGVRFVIVSPVPMYKTSDYHPNPAIQNQRLTGYWDAIRNLANDRKAAVVDLFGPLYRRGSDDSICGDGPHLSNGGYHLTAFLIERATRTDPVRSSALKLDVDGLNGIAEVATADSIDVSQLHASKENIRFEGKLNALKQRLNLAVIGLPAGEYAVQIDGKAIASTTASELSNEIVPGVELDLPDADQYEQLRQAIIAKNELYYHHWRPQNITYLFGFRKHEQGQNAKEVEEFEKLVAAKEAEIHKLKQPVPHTYELIRVEESEAAPNP